MKKITAICMFFALSLSPLASSADIKVGNYCSDKKTKLNAMLFDAGDMVVAVPKAKALNIPLGKRVKLTGLDKKGKYKIHFTGSCGAKAHVSFMGIKVKGSTPRFSCNNGEALDVWYHIKGDVKTIDCKYS